ncbi:cytochrome P450 [Amycolatopsis minnesotensis]|uniref:Cytochrome P450 n=1 Tax=Amycolatopsis minnesotensis TaxID=337894 RepID=A0ABN2S8I5_9PSEU
MPSSALPLPNGRLCPFGPAPEIGAIRESPSLPRVSCPTGIDAWLVTRYADAREVLGDPHRFSSKPGTAGHILANTPPDAPIDAGQFVRMDGADHLRFRRVLAPAISTAKRIAAIEPMVRRIVDDKLDELGAGARPVDLHEQFAQPVTTAVIAELFGVPESDRGLFHQAADALFLGTAEELDVLVGKLYQLLMELIARRRSEPTEDSLGILVGRGPDLTDFELFTTAVTTLLAGYDTTSSMISHATLALLRDPAQFALLREDPAVLPGAVEEFMRLLGSAGAVLRVATADTVLSGTPIAAGDYVVVSVQGANHDPAQFADPGRLDLRRDARQHLAFGFGPHRCVGQQLARMELTVVLGTLSRRVPGLRLTVPFDEIEFKTGTPNTGPVSLPVTWDELLPRPR